MDRMGSVDIYETRRICSFKQFRIFEYIMLSNAPKTGVLSKSDEQLHAPLLEQLIQ